MATDVEITELILLINTLPEEDRHKILEEINDRVKDYEISKSVTHSIIEK